MMGNAGRLDNFNPGPAALPWEVLLEAQRELADYRGTGMSLLEMSHRSAVVEELTADTERRLLGLLGLEQGTYHALFMGGGASTQFALLAMNFLSPQQTASYVLTGSFAERAYREAQYVSRAQIAASSKEQQWRHIPQLQELQLPEDAAYLHVTTNNTIEGSRLSELPNSGDVPLFADMTSDLLSRQLDYGRFALMYAGAQKNLGPAGVTAVIIKDELLAKGSQLIPLIMRYETFVRDHSLYNTPPVQAIYMMNLVLRWTEQQGGVAALERGNAEKAALLYAAIDASGGFYRGIIAPKDRSHMNVTWTMADEALERRFLQAAEREGFAGLAGHRSVGGLRASAYNAVPLSSCRALAEFMAEFQRKFG